MTPQKKQSEQKQKKEHEPLVIKVSASGVPRFFMCASSAVVIDAPFNPSSGASDVGDATHDGCASMVLGKPVDVDELAEKHKVEDKTDLQVCMAYARQAWQAIKQHFPNPKVEQRIESDLVNGMLDLMHHDGETAAITDWKSGRVPGNATEQLASYAYAMRQKFGMPRSGFITGIAVWLRFSQMDVRKMDDTYLDQFADTFKAQMKQAGRQFAPSYDACGFCLRQNECPARRDYISAAGAAMIVHQTEAESGAMTAELLGKLYPQSKMLEKALDAYKDALKQAASRGQVSIGEGKVMRLNEYRKEVINDVQATWKALVGVHGFKPEDMARVCKLSLTEIKEVVAERAEDGAKAKAKVAISKALADAGCISSVPYTKMTVMKG